MFRNMNLPVLAGLVTAVLLLTLTQGSCASDFQTVHGPLQLTVTDGFTVAVIPDTQCYTSEGGGKQPDACGGPHSRIKNEMFLAQARYIDENRSNARIVAVAGTGDIVNCGDEISEWENAKRGYDIIDATGLPYAPVIGNHDYDSWCISGFSSRSAVNYNSYFGPSRFAGKSWYGGHFPANSNENFFIRFSVDGRDYVVLALEHIPREAALDWARQVVVNHADSQVIIIINEFLTTEGLRNTRGQVVWDRLIRPHSNVIAVLDSSGGTRRRLDVTDSGSRVPQMSSGYQWEEAGGSGYMRLLRFRPARKEITVTTYSPYLQRRRLDPDNDFTVQYGIP